MQMQLECIVNLKLWLVVFKAMVDQRDISCSATTLHCWHWHFSWPLSCPWLKQTATDHHSQSCWLSKAVCLIVCKSGQRKQNNCRFSFPPFVAVAYWPWCVPVPLFKTSVWWRSHITELHFWSTNRWPSTSVPRLPLLLSSNNNNQCFNIRRFWRTTYKSYASPAGLLAAKLTLLKRFFDPALLWFTFLSPF